MNDDAVRIQLLRRGGEAVLRAGHPVGLDGCDPRRFEVPLKRVYKLFSAYYSVFRLPLGTAMAGLVVVGCAQRRRRLPASRRAVMAGCSSREGGSSSPVTRRNRLVRTGSCWAAACSWPM